MALVKLSVVEQRYHVVMEVLAGAPVTEVAGRYGVSRQSVNTWMRRYRPSTRVRAMSPKVASRRRSEP